MHIVVCSTDYPPMLGGIARYSYHMAKALAQCDVVTVLAARSPGDNAFDRGQPFTTIRVPMSPILREAFLLRALLAIHRSQHIDWILNAVWFPCGLVSHLGRRLAGLRYLVSAYGSEIFDDRRTWRRAVKGLCKGWKRRMLAEASLVLPVSRYTRDRLLQDGVTAPIFVLNGGVDIETFRPGPKSHALIERLGLRPSAPVLLSIGRLDLHKGHDVVIRALPRILAKVPELVYLIVGEGPERRSLENLIARLGLSRTVVMVGEVSDAELVEYYNLSDVFILLSREVPGRLDLIEGFGIVFLEASACAKPVIAGNSGGVLDAVLHGETGLVVNPLDPEAVTDAVARLCQDPAYARRLGACGRARCEEELNWAKLAARLRERLERV